MNKSFLVDEEGNQGDGHLGRKSNYVCLIGLVELARENSSCE